MSTENEKKEEKRNRHVDAFMVIYNEVALRIPGFSIPVAPPTEIGEDSSSGRTTTMLFFLGYKHRCRMSDIAQLFNIHPSTATLLVDKWVEQGLITRVTSKKDRRVVLLKLAEKGRMAFKKVRKDIHDRLDYLFSNLTEEEQGELIRLIAKLVLGKPKGE